MFHVKPWRGRARHTVKYARASRVRSFLYYESWAPSTHEQPPHDRPYGAVVVRRSA